MVRHRTSVGGVPFVAFYRAVIEPVLTPGAVVTHLGFGGLDGYRCFVLIEDALADGVLIAERLDGRPLDSDHGAPVRLVSPAQYGYKSTKHLRRIDVRTLEAPPPAPDCATCCSRITRGRGCGRRSATARSPRGSSVRSIAR